MRNKVWINAALLAAVVALALVAWLKPQKADGEIRLSALKASEVDRIKLDLGSGAPILLERAPAGWQLTAPLAMRADDFQVQRLLAILDATAKERFPATGLARFDLNEPYARVTFNRQSFSFGAVNQMSREQYVLTQDGVHLVDLRHAAALPKDALQLASKQLFAADEAPLAFEAQDFSLVLLDGKWQLTPARADASADDINRWVDEWKLATASAVRPASGRKPESMLKVKLKNGQQTTLAILQREPELILARGDRALEYHIAAEVGKRLLAPPAERQAK